MRTLVGTFQHRYARLGSCPAGPHAGRCGLAGVASPWSRKGGKMTVVRYGVLVGWAHARRPSCPVRVCLWMWICRPRFRGSFDKRRATNSNLASTAASVHVRGSNDPCAARLVVYKTVPGMGRRRLPCSMAPSARSGPSALLRSVHLRGERARDLRRVLLHWIGCMCTGTRPIID